MQKGKVIFYNLDRWNFQEFYQKLCSQDPLKIFITFHSSYKTFAFLPSSAHVCLSLLHKPGFGNLPPCKWSNWNKITYLLQYYQWSKQFLLLLSCMYHTHADIWKARLFRSLFILQSQYKQVFFLSSGPHNGVLSAQTEADFWIYY